MSNILTLPEYVDTATSTEVSHFVHSDDLMRGLVHGENVQALCGKVWVPSAGDSGEPICADCEHIRAMMQLQAK